jgi:hypothetical protein
MKRIALLFLLAAGCGRDVGGWTPPDLAKPKYTAPADNGGCLGIDPGTCAVDFGVPDLAEPEDDNADCTCDRPEHGKGAGHCHVEHQEHSQGHGNGHCKFDCE